jgi:DNA-binding MarR family transcriptional regulator
MAAAKPSPSSGPDAGLVVRAVLRLARRLRAERPRDGVSLASLALLATLRRDGPMPAARLAEAERLQPQSLTRLLAALERAGLIARTPGTVDRRTTIVALTERGRRALRRDLAARRAWLERAMERRLASSERERLHDAALLMLRLTDTGDRRP